MIAHQNGHHLQQQIRRPAGHAAPTASKVEWSNGPACGLMAYAVEYPSSCIFGDAHASSNPILMQQACKTMLQGSEQLLLQLYATRSQYVAHH